MGATFIPSVQTIAEYKHTTSAFRAVVRVVALALLLTASATYEAKHLTALFDTNVWLHLRTGTWILETHSVPQSGLFSQSSNLPWMDSSWGSDVVLAVCYRFFGLRAIPLLLMIFKVGLAVVTYLLARSGKANFWAAVCLSAVAQYVVPVSQSLPYVLSIVFFGIELFLLERARRTGSIRHLYWLPAVFWLWANLHALFVGGLLLFAVFLISISLEQVLKTSSGGWLDEQTRLVPLSSCALLFGGSLLAVLVNPYTYRVFGEAYRLLYSAMGFQYFAELRAMSFRSPQDYVLMLLVMAAFLALGRRRSVNIFELLTLIGGTLVAFRIQREAWMAVLPAIAVLSRGFGFREQDNQALLPLDNSHVSQRRRDMGHPSFTWEKLIIALTAAAILAIAGFRMPGQKALMLRVGQSFPVKACDFIRGNHLPQPIFNEYSWGSFLAWYLPEYPVAIDSRIDLYGDDVTENYFRVIAGGVRLDTNPSLAAARTLILQKQSGMTKALTTLPTLTSQYRLAYSDYVAAVFVKQ
jgi:hypothetical protein